VFHFSSWLRTIFPRPSASGKRSPRRTCGSALRLELLEARLTPDSGGAANPNLLASGNLIDNSGGLGPLLANVQIQPIYLKDNSGSVSSMQSSFDGFFSTITSDGYIPGLLNQYSLPSPTAPASSYAIANFGGNGTGWQLNGHAAVSSDVLTLTDGKALEASSAFDLGTQIARDNNFLARFTYTPSGNFPNQAADGIAFVLQDATSSSAGGSGTKALGGSGSSLGYTGISGPSLAVGLNLYPNSNIGGVGTCLTINGGTFFGSQTQFASLSHVTLNNSDPKNIALSYNSTAHTITENVTDPVAHTYDTVTFTGVDLSSLFPNNPPFVGFTGSDGGFTSTQTISQFRLASGVTSGASLGVYDIGNGTVGSDDVAVSQEDTTVRNHPEIPAYSDSDIQSIIRQEITAGNTAAVNSNTLYVVLTPPNAAVVKAAPDGSNYHDSTIYNPGFRGYHSSFNLNASTTVYYAVIPDQTNSFNLTAAMNVPGGSAITAFQGETVAASHEISEAITDPLVNVPGQLAWNDSANGEVGDMAVAEAYTQDGYAVQYEWSQPALDAAHASVASGLFINQITPPAVTSVSTSAAFPVATFTDTDSTAFTANRLTATVYFDDGNGAQPGVISGGANNVYTISASPLHPLAANQYGKPFNESQRGMIVTLYDSSGPLSYRYVPYTTAASAPFIYNADAGGVAHNFRLVQDTASGNIQLYDSDQLVFTQPLAATTGSITIGADPGVDSTLTIDFSGGNFNGLPINFDGGTGNGSHGLFLVHTPATSADYNYTNGTSGSVVLSTGSQQTINFTDTSFIRDNNGETSESFTLPSGAQAQLKLDTVFIGNTCAISSTNNTSVNTIFECFGTSLTVNTTGGNSVVTLGIPGNGFSTPPTETFRGQAGDVFRFAAANAIRPSTSVTLLTATLDLNGFNPTIDGLNGTGIVTNNAASTTSILTVGSNGANARFTGVIQDGSGIVGLTLDSSGSAPTQALAGVNTYSGPTTINAGTLRTGIANALPAGSAVTLANKAGVTLNLNAFNNTIASLSGGGASGGNVALGTGTLTITGSSSATFAGVISGTGGFRMNGPGGLQVLSGANTYQGRTTIDAGTLRIGATTLMAVGHTLTVPGTSGNDTYTFTPGAGQDPFTLNGATYFADVSAITSVQFQGNGGTDTAVLNASGTGNTATLTAGSGQLTGGTYSASASGVTVLYIVGGATDTASFTDTTGTGSFLGTPGYSYLKDGNLVSEVIGFKFAVATGKAGNHSTAIFYDSAGNDTFVGTPTFGYMATGGVAYAEGIGFQTELAFHLFGGTDTALLFDGPGNNIFVGAPSYAYLAAGGVAYAQADYFQVVQATSAGGSNNDSAYFYDSAGNDVFVGTPAYSYLAGSGFLNQANGFQSVNAYSVAGGQDTALLFDSPGDDTFGALGSTGSLSGSGYGLSVQGFASVTASSSTGNDHKSVGIIDFVLSTPGNWQ
jgi:autotransporter-associated beta strand protein